VAGEVTFQTLVSLGSALVAAFFGSWFGVLTAMTRFKKERAFDRQLDWYERMVRSLFFMAQRIDIATTFLEDPAEDPAVLPEVWERVQTAHLKVEEFANEAPLYASADASKWSADIRDAVQDVANKTKAFDGASRTLTKKQIDLIERLSEKLVEAANPLAMEARRHLGIR